MFQVYRKELEWGGRPLVLETGRFARQADGAVLVTYGETTVLCTAVAMKSAKAGQDFFPLTVNYQEKTFAAGKIPGGFFKREGRPSEKETLVSRLIDRPLRPLFVPGLLNETQVICTVLSHDLENDPDIVALIGASAALTISGIPFLGPIGGAGSATSTAKYVLNPTLGEMPRSQLDLVVAGTGDGVLMVESEAKELSEEVMLGAVTFGHREFPAGDPGDHRARRDLRPGAVEHAARTAEQGRDRSATARDDRSADRGRLSRAWQAGTQQPARCGEGAGGRAVFRRACSARLRSSCSRTSRRRSCAAPFCGTDSGSTAATPGRCDRSSARSASCRARTARRCSPAARRRRSPWRRSGPARTSRSSTRSKASIAKTSCCTTTSRPIRPARPGGMGSPGTARDRSWQARLAGDSAAAADEGELPLHDPRRFRDHRIERLVVDGLGVRRLARADGCRRAAAATGRRHRDGADQGAGGLCRVVRHSRRRGSSRRHGLQGRRHRARRHGAADGHQDHLDHRGDHADRSEPGARRPHSHPRRDGQGADRCARRGQRECAAHHDASAFRRTRSAR